MSESGYVYVLMNPALEGLLKVGKTNRSPAERARELSAATGVPTPFLVVYEEYFRDCNSAEKYVHTRLEADGYRHTENREFFSAPPKVVIDAVMEAREYFADRTPSSEYEEHQGKVASPLEEGGVDDNGCNADTELDNDDDDFGNDGESPADKFQQVARTSKYLGNQLVYMQYASHLGSKLSFIAKDDYIESLRKTFQPFAEALNDALKTLSDYQDTFTPICKSLREQLEILTGSIDPEHDEELHDLIEQTLEAVHDDEWDDESDEENEEPDQGTIIRNLLFSFSEYCSYLAFFSETAEKDSFHALRDHDQLNFESILRANKTTPVKVKEEIDSISDKLQIIAPRLDKHFDSIRQYCKRAIFQEQHTLAEDAEGMRDVFVAYRLGRDSYSWRRGSPMLTSLLNFETSGPWDDILSQARAAHYGDEEDGILQDANEAVRLYKMASRLGSGDADIALGDLSVEQESGADIAQAKAHYEAAVRKGMTVAYLKLAELFFGINERNTQICLRAYVKASKIDVGKHSDSVTREVLGFLRSIALHGPIPSEIAEPFVRIREELNREFQADPIGAGTFSALVLGLLGAGDQTVENHMEDAIDLMDR